MYSQVKILVNSGAYVDARDTNERTALYLAAGRGHDHIVKYLVANGANVNSEEIHGMSLLTGHRSPQRIPLSLIFDSLPPISGSHPVLITPPSQ